MEKCICYENNIERSIFRNKPLTFTSTLKTSSHFSVTLLHTIEGIKNSSKG